MAGTFSQSLPTIDPPGDPRDPRESRATVCYVLSDTLVVWRYMMFIFCVKEAGLGMMAFVACFALGFQNSTPPPPLYKLRPCPSYSRRRDRNNCVRNFNCVRNVVRPHETWVCRHICQLHGAMDTCNMPHARQFDFQEFEVARAQTNP